MGTASKSINHDWLAVRARFPDRTKANITWSRSGETVTTVPDSSPLAHTLSAIVVESKARMKEPDYPFRDLGQVATVVEETAKSAHSLSEFVEQLKSGLRVSGALPTSGNSSNGPAQTQARIIRGRSLLIEAHFPSDEKITLKLTGRSVGIIAKPDIPSLSSALMTLVYGVRALGMMSDEAIAEACLEAANSSTSGIEWLEQIKSKMTPKP